MIGLPDEGPKEILETIKLNAEIKADLSVVSIFYPYKGTRLYDVCIEKGYFKEESKIPPKNYYSYSVLSLPTIKKEQIGFFFHYFHFLKKIYNFLFQLPFPRFFIFLADRFFSFKYVPQLMNAVLNPIAKAKKKARQSKAKQDTEVISK